MPAHHHDPRPLFIGFDLVRAVNALSESVRRAAIDRLPELAQDAARSSVSSSGKLIAAARHQARFHLISEKEAFAELLA